VSTASPFESAAVPPYGSHALPPRFSGPPASAQRRRKPILAITLGALGIVAIAATLAGVQVGANLRFDSAAEDHRATSSEVAAARSDLESADAELQSTVAAAQRIVDSNTGALMESAPLDVFTTAISDATAASGTADELASTSVPRIAEKPGWFWELFGTADALDEQNAEMADLRDDIAHHSPELDDAETAVTENGIAVLTAAAAAAPAFETAHVSARNLDIIALREAAEEVAAVGAIDDESADRFVALQSAASQVVASQDAELAEKSGPLYNARLEVEAFARSLAPGVLLEFDWAPIVNGVGFNGSMGGYTTWWWDEPDRSVILLSNSVAEQWPADRSRALVAHEVGHSISVKCEDMYDSSTQDSIEKWATAWAISMGFTDDANGVWAYGYPPQGYIDAAAGCR
jgi:hypothetical protein